MKLLKILKNLFSLNKKKYSPVKSTYYHGNQKNIDHICLKLDEYLKIKLTRELTYDIPHEVTIIVPRAEIRQEKVFANGEKTTSEIILNSVTVVHSPQRPSNR